MPSARVVTVSDRSYAGQRADTSGPLLADLLTASGFAVDAVVVVPDEAAQIRAALRAAAADGVAVCLTTGGTGFAPRDVTPEATAQELDRPAPGLAEAVHRAGADAVPTAILSRGVAGLIGSTIVVNLPGSTGGVRDAMAVLAPVLPHAVAQVHGQDH